MLWDSLKDNAIAAGGIVRSDRGTWVIGFTKFIGIGEIIMAEAWTVYIGLQISYHQYKEASS